MTVLLQLITTWFVAFVAWLALSVLVALPTAWIWNRVMPTVFGLPEIGTMQAFGLLVLSSLLLSSRSVEVKTYHDD